MSNDSLSNNKSSKEEHTIIYIIDTDGNIIQEEKRLVLSINTEPTKPKRENWFFLDFIGGDYYSKGLGNRFFLSVLMVSMLLFSTIINIISSSMSIDTIEPKSQDILNKVVTQEEIDSNYINLVGLPYSENMAGYDTVEDYIIKELDEKEIESTIYLEVSTLDGKEPREGYNDLEFNIVMEEQLPNESRRARDSKRIDEILTEYVDKFGIKVKVKFGLVSSYTYSVEEVYSKFPYTELDFKDVFGDSLVHYSESYYGYGETIDSI